MEGEKSFIERIKPKTVGERMFAAGIGMDLSYIALAATLTYLKDEEVTHFTPEQFQSVINVLFWSVHIILSDIVLKLGGAIKMSFFEEENWVRKGNG